MGSLIPAVGLKYIVPVQSQESTGTVRYRYQRPEACCGLLSSGCGSEVNREIPAVGICHSVIQIISTVARSTGAVVATCSSYM